MEIILYIIWWYTVYKSWTVWLEPSWFWNYHQCVKWHFCPPWLIREKKRIRFCFAAVITIAIAHQLIHHRPPNALREKITPARFTTTLLILRRCLFLTPTVQLNTAKDRSEPVLCSEAVITASPAQIEAQLELSPSSPCSLTSSPLSQIDRGSLS